MNMSTKDSSVTGNSCRNLISSFCVHLAVQSCKENDMQECIMHSEIRISSAFRADSDATYGLNPN